MFGALESALEEFHIATAGAIAPIGKTAIDHIAHSGEFEAIEVASLSNIAADGRQISDHFGVAVQLRRSASRTPQLT